MCEDNEWDKKKKKKCTQYHAGTRYIHFIRIVSSAVQPAAVSMNTYGKYSRNHDM